MSLDAPNQLDAAEGVAQHLTNSSTEVPLSNPDGTACSTPGSHRSGESDVSGDIHVSGAGGHISPSLTVRTPLSSNRNSLVSSSSTAKVTDQTVPLPNPAGENVSASIDHPTSLSAAVSQILSQSSAKSAAGSSSWHKGQAVGPPRTAPCSYAKSRRANPQGYLFTCYLDYTRSVKPPPAADCFGSYVRPERLQYTSSTACSSPCETPRSSASIVSIPGLYSRPPTPAPLLRPKEVHKFAMTGVPVDVKELCNCYLFVAEIPGMKSSDIKVQIENDSILKITGEKRREQCEQCEIKYVRVERQAGRFTRKFNLPANADLDHISAACQDGLLSVLVPKSPPPDQHRPKSFEVKIANT